VNEAFLGACYLRRGVHGFRRRQLCMDEGVFGGKFCRDAGECSLAECQDDTDLPGAVAYKVAVFERGSPVGREGFRMSQ